VSGTTGDDTMGPGYVDKDGDHIDGPDGTDGTIDGGAGRDSIDAGAGDDLVLGGGGNDTLHGGAGDDTLDGGTAGPVTWTAVANGAVVMGTPGGEYFRVLAETGANARVTLDGGTGTVNDGDGVADYVMIATTNSTNLIDIRGFDYGIDRIVVQEMPVSSSFTANPGSLQGSITYANGKSQQIHLSHSGPRDFVFTDIFTTEVPLAPDDDSRSGGDGADVFIVRDGFGNDTIDGGAGSDALDASALTGPVSVTFTGDGTRTLTDGTDTVSFTGIEGFVLTEQTDFLSSGADAAGHSVEAGGGDDTIWGGLGDDTSTEAMGTTRSSGTPATI
jgi:Ca2+-binding RTX toxin-like protein